MTCEHCIEALLEADLSDPPAELRAHLGSCASCREVAERLRQTERAAFDGLERAIDDGASPPAVAQPRARRWWMGMDVMLAVAAALAVVVYGAAPLPKADPEPVPVVAPALETQFAAEVARSKVLAETPWNGLTEAEWMAAAQQLRPAADAWIAGEPSPNGARVLYETGRAAEYANDPIPPFYEEEGVLVNWYWYRLGLWIDADPTLGAGFDADVRKQLASTVQAVRAKGKAP